ncbi:hypothetical protein YPPY91_3217, partial [Yersinia pestis PY-91]
MRIGR